MKPPEPKPVTQPPKRHCPKCGRTNLSRVDIASIAITEKCWLCAHPQRREHRQPIP